MLRPTATFPVDRGYSGLYHFAINLPDEPAFAQLLARLLDTGARPSTTEHVVAKSIYLADSDGIGLELIPLGRPGPARGGVAELVAFEWASSRLLVVDRSTTLAGGGFASAFDGRVLAAVVGSS